MQQQIQNHPMFAKDVIQVHVLMIHMDFVVVVLYPNNHLILLDNSENKTKQKKNDNQFKNLEKKTRKLEKILEIFSIIILVFVSNYECCNWLRQNYNKLTNERTNKQAVKRSIILITGFFFQTRVAQIFLKTKSLLVIFFFIFFRDA